MMSKREFIARLLMVLGILGLPIASFNYENLSRFTRRAKELEQQLAGREEKIKELEKKVKDLEKEVGELTQKAPSPPPPSPPPSPPPPPRATVKEFEFSCDEKWRWNLHDITVNKGDIVRITIRGGGRSGASAFSINPYAFQWFYQDVVVIEFEAVMQGEFKMFPTGCHCPWHGMMEYKLTVI